MLSSNDQLSHDLLNAWLDVSKNGLCVSDDTDRVVLLNPAACEMLDIDLLSSLDKPSLQIFRNAVYLHGRLEWLRSADLTEKRQEVISKSTGNLHVMLQKRLIKNANGDVFKALGLTDVTEAVEAQKLLETHQRQWQAMNAGVVIADATLPSLPIIYINAAFEKMTGYAAKEVLGRNCNFLQGEERFQAAIEPIRRAILEKTNGYAVLKNYRKDGSQFINELFISPVSDASGKVVQFVGIQHMRASDFKAREQ